MKKTLLAASLVLSLAACATTPVTPLTIDGSTDAAAEASWARMLGAVDSRKRMELLTAMVAINLQGVESVYDVAGNEDLHKLSISRVREQLDGMTADEILAYAGEVSTVKIRIEARQ